MAFSSGVGYRSISGEIISATVSFTIGTRYSFLFPYNSNIISAISMATTLFDCGSRESQWKIFPSSMKHPRESHTLWPMKSLYPPSTRSLSRSSKLLKTSKPKLDSPCKFPECLALTHIARSNRTNSIFLSLLAPRLVNLSINGGKASVRL